jgi:D-alanyl-D-alanine carboxypeptidase (penicillin-binding protein 5/6)
MRSLPPITAHNAKTTIQRHWRAGLAAIAGLLVVIVATVPWQSGSDLKPAADGGVAAVSASPTTTGAARAGAAQAGAAGAAGAAKTGAAPKAANAVTKLNTDITLRASGKTKMPWPSKGQASISVAGVGSFGVSGSATPKPTASVAKAMTAYLILKDHPLKGHPLKLSVHRNEALAFRHELALGQSLVPVRSGEVLTERQALQALMLASADNMAKILARWDAGSVPAFLKKMNVQALALGMTHTHYTDPSGYDKRTKSTVTDQMKLANAAMHLPGYQTVVSERTAVIPVAGKIQNFNKLLGEPGVVGIKTGSMSAAGGCLLFAAKSKVAGHTVTILGTVLGQRSGSIGDLHQAFVSSHNLLTAVHKALRPVKIVQKNQVVAKVPGTKSVLVSANDVTIPGWRGMVVPSKVSASVKAGAPDGTKAGTLTVGHVGKATLVVRNTH